MSDPDFIIPDDQLPPGFAESIDNVPDEPAKPRPAATVVLARDGVAAPEILLLRRVRNTGFVPGAYVFPGGRVDDADGRSDLVMLADGLSASEAESRLGHSGTHPPAIAYYMAAIREAFEETGILLGRSVSGTHGMDAAADTSVLHLRDALLDGSTTFEAVIAEMGARLELNRMEYLAHWVTPAVEPRRYDTRFFLAGVPAGTEAAIHASEMTAAVWLTAEAALARNHEGTLPMVFPTIRTLQDLRGFATVADALRELARHRIPTIEPRLVRTPTGVGMELPESLADE